MAVKIDWKLLDSDPVAVVKQITKLDTGALDQELVDQPQLYGEVSVMFEMSRAAEAVAKHDLEVAKAAAFQRLIHGEEKIAIGKADKLILLDEKVEKANNVYLQIYRKTAALRALTLTLVQRHDMLIQISSRQKAELSQY